MPKEIYKAKVSRVNDPQNLGRIRVTCEALAGNDVEIPIWAEPIFPQVGAKSWGWFLVPDPGDEVEIEVTVNDHTDEIPGESFITNPDMRYRTGAYGPNNKIPEEFKTNYPKRRGFKTQRGHLFFFDDTEDKEELTIKATFGSKKPTTIQLTKDQITIDNVDANFDIKVKTANLIDGADAKMVRGDPDLKNWITQKLKVFADTHIHGTPVGPSSPATTQLDDAPSGCWSEKAKLK